MRVRPCGGESCGHNHSMKCIALFILAGISLSALVSCESTKSKRAGGGAFDDSETGRLLDGNALLPDPEYENAL